MTPTQLVNWAKRCALDVIAITDHDTLAGNDEAIRRGAEVGIKVLPGIEISAYAKFEIHILGYNIDGKNQAFLDALAETKRQRIERNVMLGDKLAALGIALDMDFCDDGVGRMNIARRMVAQKHVKDTKEALDRYLGPMGLAYVVTRRTLPFEAVKMIADCGGIAALAHPKKYGLDRGLELLIEGLIPYGLKGLEVFYPTHTEHETAILTGIAKKHKLIMTGGSDFHGDEDKDFIIDLPDDTKRVLKI